MLNIICGSAGSGKSRFIYNKISALAKEGKKSLLIVPESMSHLAERRLLLSCGNSVSRYAKVTTLSHLTSDIFFTCGLRDKYLDNGGRVLSMYRAISQLEGKLQYYGSEVQRPALVASMLDVTNEFIHSGVDEGRLSRLAPSLSPKMQDISLIYTSYLSVCRDSSLDPAVAMDIASEHITQSGIFEGTYVFFDDFTAYSEQKMRFIDHIIFESEEVTFSILTNEDPIVFYEQHKLRSRLCDMVSRRGEKPNIITLPRDTKSKAPELCALEHLFEPKAPKYEGEVNAVELFSAENMAQECELVAAKIRWLILKEGARLRDIAVVCGNESDYTSLLESAFQRYDIPHFFSRREDVLKKPAYAAALGPIACLCDGLRLETVLSYIKCGLLGLDDDNICKLENYALMWGISGNRWLEPFTKCTNGFDMPTFDEDERLTLIETARQKAVASILVFKELSANCKNGGDFAAAFSEYLKRVELRRLFEDRMASLNRSERYQDASEYAQLYEILTSALAQFEGVCGNLPMDIGEFRQLLSLTLGQYDVSSIPTSLDSVTVGTFARMSGYGIKHLFIIGARYGALPPETPSGSILTEGEREALEAHSISLPKNEDKSLSLQADVYRAFNAPTRSLTVTRPLFASDGTLCQKSHLVSSMQRVLSNLDERVAADQLKYLRLTAPKPAFELACTATERENGFFCPPSAEALAARSRLSKNKDMLHRFDFLNRYANAPRDIIKNTDVLRKLYGKYLPVSASAVEKFSSCRFMYFCQYGLRAQEQKTASLGALQVGTMVHAVVENAIKSLSLGDDTNPVTAAYKFTDKYVAENLTSADSPRMKAIIAQIKENAAFVTRDVWEEIQSSDFKPAYFEMDINFGKDAEPLVWEENGFSFVLKGKIDRVDRFGDYLKVVDYKTGTKHYALGDILYGRNLQPFIYMLMLRNAGLGENCAALFLPAKAEYLSSDKILSDEEAAKKRWDSVRRLGIVRSDSHILWALEHRPAIDSPHRWLPVDINKSGEINQKKSRLASKDQLERIISYTQQKLFDFSKKVSSGDISISPYNEDACKYCAFKYACHFDVTKDLPPAASGKSFEDTESVIAEIEREEACRCEEI